MSVCRHELGGGVQPPSTPRQFQPWLIRIFYANRVTLLSLQLSPQLSGSSLGTFISEQLAVSVRLFFNYHGVAGTSTLLSIHQSWGALVGTQHAPVLSAVRQTWVATEDVTGDGLRGVSCGDVDVYKAHCGRCRLLIRPLSVQWLVDYAFYLKCLPAELNSTAFLHRLICGSELSSWTP